MTQVKICGITRREDAMAAIDAGANALGFILYPKSPRFIVPERVAEIIAILPPFCAAVAVLVDPAAAEIAALARRVPFTHWQLHGAEPPELVEAIKPLRAIKALRLPWSESRERLAAYDVGAFLLDTPSSEHGGTGRAFDWNLIAAFRELTPRPLILSGGLTPDNIGEAVRRVQPWGVDVSSGVERAPGVKDHEKIRKFIHACRHAAPQEIPPPR